MKAAVIGIGSNSVRMLAAEIEGNVGHRLLRNRASTRLFAGLDEHRMLSEESMERTLSAVRNQVITARSIGAEEVSIFATSATRDAANGPYFAQLVLERTGYPLHISSGTEEAALSFAGATDGGDCGVIDIGGGSTEVIVGEGMNVSASLSCQMGAVRLFRLIDIRSRADIPDAIAAAKGVLRDQLDQVGDWPNPSRWWGTGGTFTALASLVRDVPWTDRTMMHGTMLSRDRVRTEAEFLSELSLAERLRIPSLQPGRADIVVHGICILLACMEELGIERITVSEYGNLDGYLKQKYRLEHLSNI